MIDNSNIYVHFVPMAVHGTVTHNEDDTYSIFLNSNDSRETQEKTYLHEVRHIERGDLYARNADDAENLAV